VAVLDGLGADRDVARSGVDDTARAKLTALERGGNDERFDARPGLEDVRDGTITVTLRRKLRAIVRVVGRLIHNRKYFARPDVEHDDRTGFRVVGLDRSFERPVREVLDTQIDTGPEAFAVSCGPDTLDVLDRATEAILEHPFGA
jgi:hypothetical protein